MQIYLTKTFFREGFLKIDPIRLQNCQFFVQFFIGYQIRIHSDFQKSLWTSQVGTFPIRGSAGCTHVDDAFFRNLYFYPDPGENTPRDTW